MILDLDRDNACLKLYWSAYFWRCRRWYSHT